MFKPIAGLLMILLLASPDVALAQSTDEDPMDLELEESAPTPEKKAPAKEAADDDLDLGEEPSDKDKAAPKAAPAEEADELDLGEEKKSEGLTDFDPKLHLDEPGVLPPGGAAPVGVAEGQSDSFARTGHVWPLWPSLAAGSVAVLSLGVGLYLVSVDGEGTDCRGEPRPDLSNCKEVYNTGGAGYALTAIGIASLAATGVFLYLYLSNPSASAEQPDEGLAGVTVAPDGRGGVVVGASGWF